MKKQAIETMKSAKQAGFTLIELMFGLAATAILTGWSVGGGSGDLVRSLFGR